MGIFWCHIVLGDAPSGKNSQLMFQNSLSVPSK